jgi:hypothetical protein
LNNGEYPERPETPWYAELKENCKMCKWNQVLGRKRDTEVLTVATSVDDGGSVEEGALAFVEDGFEPPPAVPDG